MIYDSKDTFKNVLLCANTHPSVTSFKVTGMVQNKKKMNISRTEREVSMK